MAFTCPHCGERGIPFLSKLLAAATASALPIRATCRSCGQDAAVSLQAVKAQIVIFVLALAAIPWLFSGEQRVTAGYAAAALILAVGLFAPMRKDISP